MNKIRKQMHFGLAIALSFSIVGAAYALTMAMMASRHLDGFIAAVYEIPLIGVVWCAIMFFWGGLIFILYRFCGWNRFRTAWLLAPAIAFCIFLLSELVSNPTDGKARFEARLNMRLPASASKIYNDYSATLFGGVTDIFYFSCSSNDTDALISAMRLDNEFGFQCPHNYNPIPLLPGAPDYHDWEDIQCYKAYTNGSFYRLLTDGAHQQVYISVTKI